MIVCIKPAGISSQNDGMGKLLSQQTGSSIFCVHRLDKAVSGVMVYAKDSRSAARLSESLHGKQYLAITETGDLPDNGSFTDLLYHDTRNNKTYVVDRMRKGVRKGILDYEILAKTEKFMLVKITLHTGRTHQIRAQFASRKLPVAGDGRYGSHVKCPLALFSFHLEIKHPVSGETMVFSTYPPKEEPWIMFAQDY